MTTRNQDISKGVLRLAREFERGCMNTNVEGGGPNAQEPWECEQCCDGFVYQVSLALAKGDKLKAQAIYEFVTEGWVDELDVRLDS